MQLFLYTPPENFNLIINWSLWESQAIILKSDFRVTLLIWTCVTWRKTNRSGNYQSQSQPRQKCHHFNKHQFNSASPSSHTKAWEKLETSSQCYHTTLLLRAAALVSHHNYSFSLTSSVRKAKNFIPALCYLLSLLLNKHFKVPKIHMLHFPQTFPYPILLSVTLSVNKKAFLAAWGKNIV